MYRKTLARKVGFPLQDFAKKTYILDTLEHLRNSQYWDDQRIEEYRVEKLRKLIAHAGQNVPYYEKLFKNIKLDASDIRSTDDIVKIPILTKEIMRSEGSNLISRNSKHRNIKIGKTGGTTGSPVTIYKDGQNRSFTWGSYYRWYEWMGLVYGDKSATFWGARTVLSTSVYKKYMDWLTNTLQNTLAINAFQMSKSDLAEILTKLAVFQPDIIKGYLSALLKLAKYMEIHSNISLRPKVLSSTSETLLPHQREYLSKIFGAPMFDQYGCGELSAISYECAEHNGLHINQEHMICEILDTDNNPALGTLGRVVGTDLDNFVMPFIRFENGDLARISETKCRCGVNQPLMTAIEGRAIDTIILNTGSSVHGVFLTDIFAELGIFSSSVQRFQAIQYSPGNIHLMLETDENLDSKLLNSLEKHLYNYFSEVKIELSAELPEEENGKFKYIKTTK
jgi:phenylacetate-CoA ligase